MKPTTLALALLLTAACQADEPASRPPVKAEKQDKTAEQPSKEAPKAQPKADKAPKIPSDVPKSVEGANLTLGEITVDGLSAKGMSCKIDGGGGLFGAPAVLGALAKEKAALDACVDGPQTPRIGWSSKDGALGDINIADTSPKAAACLAGVLGKIKVPKVGTCAMTLSLGK